MELTLDHDGIREYTLRHGLDATLEMLNKKVESILGWGLGLFSISVDWQNDRRYILKCKGSQGDLIVTWA